MKVAVVGASGQLGSDLCKELSSVELVPLVHSEMEISDLDCVKRVFDEHQPDVVINTAAYVRVDDCEREQDKAFLINALGARNVAVAAQELGAKLVYISTDYVFGGDAQPRNIPYTEFDAPIPLSIYGKSKLGGGRLRPPSLPQAFYRQVFGAFRGCWRQWQRRQLYRNHT